MAGNGGGASTNAAAAAAASAVGSAANTRFPPQERRRRWGGCWGGLSCFGSHKGGKRIVPASRVPEGNGTASRANGPQPVGSSNQTTNITPSLLAPPSSPASFTNSALPSTAQSPNCFLSMSANSPGGPSSTMYATGPYAHETQLVSPPVFSTYTTEPSTAPFTPPPELAHLTTPSSPDVPYAQFLSSSLKLKSGEKENGMTFMSSGFAATTSDLQATYPLYPGSPGSSLISPVPGTPRDGLCSYLSDREIPSRWGASISAQDSPCPRSASSRLFGLDPATSGHYMLTEDSSFFCPATSAQFHLDQAQQSFSSYSHCGGRLSLSREQDVFSNGGGRHSKACKQDVEEIEAYRASFGFSADEIISTQNYVATSDAVDISFSVSPFASHKLDVEQCSSPEMINGIEKKQTTESILFNPKGLRSTSRRMVNRVDHEAHNSCNRSGGLEADNQSEDTGLSNDDKNNCSIHHNHPPKTDDDEIFSNAWGAKVAKKYRLGLSSSDAEIDYRRGRSLRDTNGFLAWHD
ncbi:hypothetical protein QJS04_geneDACA009356 [Acorus gramineus]|uniref:Uncharacterized protein n=1 Tax=Acorus gramineus TaxID=55184 RepID=A0AAV9AFX5_ACOGR|nr:hypothetical protein QJS04_geneDACA009356 [Acorus gramineus]